MLLLRVTPAGLVVDEVNTVAAEQLGSEVGELLGRPWGSGLTPADRDEMSRGLRPRSWPAAPTGWVHEVRLARGE